MASTASVPVVHGLVNVSIAASDQSGFLKEVEHRYVNAGDDPDIAANVINSVIYSFTVDDKAGWIIFLPVNEPAGDNQDYLATILQQQIAEAGGDAVINVKIRAQNQPIDIIAYICTLGFYQSRTVTVSGDVIKYN